MRGNSAAMSPRDIQVAEKMVTDLTSYRSEGSNILESKKELLTNQSELESQWWIIDPDDYRRRLWDFAAIWLVIYNALVIPFNLAFVPNDEYSEEAQKFDRAVDFFFGVDIVLNFVTGYQTSVSSGSQTVIDQRKIIKHYLLSWFLIDFVSTFPFDMIFSQVYAQATNLIKLLKLSRLLRLLRIFRLVRIINRLEFALLVRAAAGTLGRYFMKLLFYLHWTACLFFLFGPGAFFGRTSSTSVTAGDGCYWMSAAEADEQCASLQGTPGGSVYDSFDGFDGAEEGGANYNLQYQQFVASLYWSIMTLTSVGYGDGMQSANTRQRFVSIFVAIGGACLFSFGISSIVAIINDLSATDKEFREEMDKLNKYMRLKQVPIPLRAEVRDYMHRENRIRQSTQVSEEEEDKILLWFNLSLRKKVALSVNRYYLSETPMLSDAPQSFIAALAETMGRQSYKPGEEIVKQGDSAEHAYIICHGLVEVVHTIVVEEGGDREGKGEELSGKPTLRGWGKLKEEVWENIAKKEKEARVGVLRKGQYVGEIPMFEGYSGAPPMRPRACKRTASMRTLSMVEARILHYDDFRTALNAHPAVLKQVCNLARLRAKRLVKIAMLAGRLDFVAQISEQAGLVRRASATQWDGSAEDGSAGRGVQFSGAKEKAGTAAAAAASAAAAGDEVNESKKDDDDAEDDDGDSGGESTAPPRRRLFGSNRGTRADDRKLFGSTIGKPVRKKPLSRQSSSARIAGIQRQMSSGMLARKPKARDEVCAFIAVIVLLSVAASSRQLAILETALDTRPLIPTPSLPPSLSRAAPGRQGGLGYACSCSGTGRGRRSHAQPLD
jgi:CRP-like cAMP-binding protein